MGLRSSYESPNYLSLMMIGRLKPGVSPETASAAVTPLFRRTLAEASPVSPNDRKPELMFSSVRGIETMRDDYQKPLRVLMTMVGVVLLIASANVAMLLLLRNAAKRREFALRRALGASARVLFGQLISESLLLVDSGVPIGVALRQSGNGNAGPLVWLRLSDCTGIVTYCCSRSQSRPPWHWSSALFLCAPSAVCRLRKLEGVSRHGDYQPWQILRPQAGCGRTDFALYRLLFVGTVAIRHITQPAVVRSRHANCRHPGLWRYAATQCA